MATIFNVLGIICLIAFGELNELHGHFLTKQRRPVKSVALAGLSLGGEQCRIVAIARSQIGVREATGNNDGPQVAQYLAYTGNKKGEPWCAAFVSWVFGQAGSPQPCTAWSPSLFPSNRLLKSPQVAAVFGIYFPAKGRIAHVGLVERVQHSWLYTIEGNTNIAGSRDGDGVYRKLRHAKTIAKYANWLAITKGGGK